MIELERAREFLEGAEVAEREGLYNVCAVCCYAAIYWAARAAVVHVKGGREWDWSHGGLRRVFSLELVKKGGLLPEWTGRRMEEAYHVRNIALYETGEVTPKRARRLLRWAREFVEAVEGVMGSEGLQAEGSG